MPGTVVYGVTGASKLVHPESVEKTIEEAFATLVAEPRAFVTGSQVGVDEIAARLALRMFPEAGHIQVIPGDPGTHGALLPESRWISLPSEKDAARAYRARNVHIVDESGELLAFPRGPESRYPRSGTWMTVRLARDAGVRVRVYPLGWGDPYVESPRS